jgi:hypothetical protein
MTNLLRAVYFLPAIFSRSRNRPCLEYPLSVSYLVRFTNDRKCFWVLKILNPCFGSNCPFTERHHVKITRMFNPGQGFECTFFEVSHLREK